MNRKVESNGMDINLPMCGGKSITAMNCMLTPPAVIKDSTSQERA